MIITAPNPALSQVAKPVAKIDLQIQKIIREMREALASASDPEGVGLAAPQIGESLRIFIAKPSPKGKIIVFINPEIIARGDTKGRAPDSAHAFGSEGETSGALAGGKRVAGPRAKSKIKKLEGCLSLKDIWGTVLRSPKITLSYQDETGRRQTKEFKDFLATIIQHEYDHLNGILFPKKVLEQKGKLYKSSKDEKGEDIFEELEI